MKNTVYKSPTPKKDTGIEFPQFGIPCRGANDVPDSLVGGQFFIYDPDKWASDPEYRKKFSTNTTSVQPATVNKIAGIGTMERSIAAAPPGEGMVTPTKAPVTKREPSNAEIGVTAGLSAIGDMAGAQKNLATNEYITDLDYWQKQGKWWFDKNADYAPTLEEYAGNMPSATEAINPAMNVLGGAAKGAATGMAVGGPVGAAVGAGAGALVGVVESIFGMSSAKKQDVKNKERTTNEYNKQLKEWTYAKNKRYHDETVMKDTARREEIKGAAQAAIGKKKEKAINKEDRRQALIRSFLGAGSVSEKQRASNISRWA